jgi:hypothetical protein
VTFSFDEESEGGGGRDWDNLYSEKYTRKYWKNKKTGEISWTDPTTGAGGGSTRTTTTKTSTTQESQSGGSDWEELFSEKYKRRYWKNKLSGETTWTNPSGAASTAAQSTSPAASPAATPRSPTVSPKRANVVYGASPTIIDPDWNELYSEKYKRKYWKHKTSGETSWRQPMKPASEAGAVTGTTALAPSSSSTSSSSQPGQMEVDSDWMELYSDKYKRKYWKNKKTGETTWKQPPKSASPGNSTSTGRAGASSDAPSSGQVADDWTERYSEKYKRKYWKNTRTGETTWKQPAVSTVASNITPFADNAGSSSQVSSSTPTSPATPNGQSDWIERFSEKYQRKYWKNSKTGETSWKEPPKSSSPDPAGSGNTSTATASSSLVNVQTPSDLWEEKYSQKYKRKYWKNKETGETTWKQPAPQPEQLVEKKRRSVSFESSPSGAESAASATSDWEERWSEKYKRKYWKNKKTGESSWKNPQGIVSSKGDNSSLGIATPPTSPKSPSKADALGPLGSRGGALPLSSTSSTSSGFAAHARAPVTVCDISDTGLPDTRFLLFSERKGSVPIPNPGTASMYGRYRHRMEVKGAGSGTVMLLYPSNEQAAPASAYTAYPSLNTVTDGLALDIPFGGIPIEQLTKIICNEKPGQLVLEGAGASIDQFFIDKNISMAQAFRNGRKHEVNIHDMNICICVHYKCCIDTLLILFIKITLILITILIIRTCVAIFSHFGDRERSVRGSETEVGFPEKQ